MKAIELASFLFLLTTNIVDSSSNTKIEKQAKLSPNDLYNQAIKLLDLHQEKTINSKDSIKHILRKRFGLWLKKTFDLRADQISQNEEYNQDLNEAVSLLENAAKAKHSDSLFLLAKMNLFSLYQTQRNLEKALEYFTILSDHHGNSTANFYLGIMYDNGLGVQPNHALSVLYHTFAAADKNLESTIILANKYKYGINVKPDCEKSHKYYKAAARRVIHKFKSGPVGGLDIPYYKPYVYTDEGGVYGENYINKKSLKQKLKATNDALEYEKYMASKGNIDYKLNLGIVYYRGTLNIKKSYKLAFYHLKDVASKVHKIKEIKNDLDEAFAVKVGEACGYVGLMYLRGEGVLRNNKTAEFWFMSGSKLKNPLSMFWYGVLRYETNNDQEGLKLITKASLQGQEKALGYLGSYYYKQKNYTQALKYYTKAENKGDFIARYMLSNLYHSKIAPVKSCEIANIFLKSTVERGTWLLESEKLASQYYYKAEFENSLIHYLILANMGFETAQANAAYIIAKKKPYLNLFKNKNISHALSFINCKQSSEQGNTISTMMVGDHFFYGRGVNKDYKKAFDSYMTASKSKANPISKWNIGYMYEHGYGAPKDYYLAKRSYDESLELMTQGYLPVTLSLLWLNLKFIIKYFSERSLVSRKRSSNEDSFIHTDMPKTYDESLENEHILDEGDPWKRWVNEHHNHLQETKDTHSDKDDILQHLSDNSKEEFITSTLNNFLILILCLLIAWLVYLRQYRLRFNNRNPQNANNQNNNHRQ